MRRLSMTVTVVAVVLAACGGGGSTARTKPAAPLTPPTTSSSSTSTTAAAPVGPIVSGFVAFGDFGGGGAQYAVATAMSQWAASHRVDALVTTGDNVYPTGEPTLYASELDAPYRALRARRPLWATLGNHDVGAGHGAEELAYLGLPSLPYEKSLSNVQLLFVDANHPDAAQAAWLDAALAKPGP